MAGNKAVTAVLSVQRSPEDDRKAEDGLRAAQRRVYRLLEPETVWDRVRTGAGAASIPNDNAARDPDRLFANSVEWIRKGWSSLCVVAPVPGAPKETLFFDGTVTYPRVGAQVSNTVVLPGDGAGYTDHEQRRIYLYMRPGKEPDDDQVRNLIVHEVQHVADVEPPMSEEDIRKEEAARAAEDTSARTDEEKREQARRDRIAWRSYQSEFRAYWLQSLQRPPQMKGGKWLDWGPYGEFGSDLASGHDVKVVDTLGVVKGRRGCLPEITVRFSNEKQARIADHLLNHVSVFGAVFLCSQGFRDQVVSLTAPQGVNLVNSIRIENLRRALTPNTSPWNGRVYVNEGAVVDWTKALDDTDFAFLKDPSASRPFWDQAKAALRQELYDWMFNYIKQGKTNVPPPVASPEAPSR
ncbi:MAG: hypothetical protein GEV03_26860 [Streptosporangiales bacterium]|nr:hypothetical protein [Streptosporangiales bacterium]